MSKGELLQEGTYQFFNLITTLQIGTIAPTLSGASASEVVMLSKVIKNFNLIFKKEAELAEQLLSEHKFLENFERGALTPITKVVGDGIEVLAVYLGCGKDFAKRVIEILKKNSKIIKKNGLVGTAKKVAEKVGKSSHEIVGSGSVLRKVEFFAGLHHGKINHFWGRGKYSLRTLDPRGNPDKWMQHIIRLAQRGKGVVKNIPTGQTMEIMGKMSKSGNSDILNIGVRLFKASASNTWKLATILTKQ